MKAYEPYENKIKRQQNELNNFINSNLKLKRQI